MTYLLFPGRHLLNTRFQARYLRRVLQVPLPELAFLDDAPPTGGRPIDHVIFAITSCNRQHSRYNPIPFHVRANVSYRIVGIPHYAPTPRFAEIILKEIAQQSENHLRLTPQNCVVLSSTPGVFRQFRQLGFSVLPAEHGEPDPAPPAPTLLLQRLAGGDGDWRQQPDLRQHLSPESAGLWCDFPDVPRRVRRLWRDPVLDDQGHLTREHDYAAYSLGLSNNEIIDVKYEDVRGAIISGKIADEGCADGALLQRVAQDFPDSDLIGIELTGQFMAGCRERQGAGQFGGTFVHFHQRNVLEPIFEAASIDTTLCNGIVHELWSYGDGEATVRDYLQKKYAQTRPGGRLIIRDVVGPEDKEQEVYLRLEHRDGANDGIDADFSDPARLAQHLASLSTYARFKRFACDFLAERRRAAGDTAETAFAYRETVVRGSRCAILPLRYAVEFMSKKEYVENWRSEMHEAFAFWSFSEWKAALCAAGFHVLENPNAPHQGSRVYTNDWIVQNRWQGAVELYRKEDGRLKPLDYPPTTVVLVGERE